MRCRGRGTRSRCRRAWSTTRIGVAAARDRRVCQKLLNNFSGFSHLSSLNSNLDGCPFLIPTGCAIRSAGPVGFEAHNTTQQKATRHATKIRIRLTEHSTCIHRSIHLPDFHPHPQSVSNASPPNLLNRLLTPTLLTLHSDHHL